MDIEALYKQDLTCIQWQRDQQALFIARARSGDAHAQQSLMLSLLPVIWSYACKLQNPPWMPAMELVGVGNITILEHFNEALDEPNPLGYLTKFARGEMIHFRRRYQNAITLGHKPDDAPFEILSILDTIDTDEFDIEDVTMIDDEENHAPLYESMQSLPHDEAREMLARLYGLLHYDQEELSALIGANSTTKIYNAAKARKLLYLKKLCNYLHERYPDYVRAHTRSSQTNKAAVYATVVIPEVTLRKLHTAKEQIVSRNEKLSMNKLRKTSGVNTVYASAYLYQYCGGVA